MDGNACISAKEKQVDFTGFDRTTQAINEKRHAFIQTGTIRDWTHRIAEGIDAPCQALYEGETQTANVGFSWSSAIGAAWFWKEVVLPEEVNGVSLAGSPADFIFILPIGATIFVNGKQIYHEPFWADTRAIELRIFDSCKPGEKLQFAIKAKSGDGFGLLLDTSIRVEALDNAALELETFREQLAFCRYLTEKSPTPEREALLAKAIEAVDLDALRVNDWAKWRKSTDAAVAILMPFNDEAKSFEVNLVAHSHIDMNWLWPWTETVELCRRDFSTMDKLMERFPDFHFSQSQVAVYKAMADYHPEVFERMNARIAQGNWEVTAATWVEGDLNTAMGETLIRQILHSKRYLRAEFGVEPKICWEPDTFGHPATLPQILKKSGIDYYYFCRAGKGHPIFWWEAPDGSRVQAYNDFFGYGGTLSAEPIVGALKPMKEHLGLNTSMKVYGVGDHGGAATALDIERGIAVNDAPLLPSTKMTGVTDFHEKVRASGIDYPVVHDELNTIFEGCYSSHGDIKWLNRYGETSLLTAETMAALASLDAGVAYPVDALADAWKNQCFHQFHDILCGCSIGSTYKEAAQTFKPSHDALRSIISDSASKLAAKVDTGSGEAKIVVLNQLAWNRTDLVEIAADSLGKDLTTVSVKDEAGVVSPAQILDGKLVFVAKDVPSLGCKVYEVLGSAAETPLRADAGSNTLENDFFRLRVNPNSGAIDSLFVKSIKRDLAQPAAGWGPEAKVNAGTLNRLKIYFEQPHGMSAWNIGDITRIDSLIAGAQVRVVKTGPAVASIEVKHSFLSSSLTQQIRVYAGLDRIDFVTEVDWHEKGGASHDAPMLKTTFSPFFGETKTAYEIPFGAIERPANGGEVPALRWADVSDDTAGITLANNCKYGHSAQGNTLALTLVRASYEPDNNPDEGLHHFTYSIIPHAGGWADSNTFSKGSELNQPLVGVVEGAHAGATKPGEALLSVDSDSIAVSAVKFAEDQPTDGTSAMIVRLFEKKGEPTKAALTAKWAVASAEEVNMLEEQGTALAVSSGSVSLDFGKHEIKTVKLIVKK